MKKKILLCLLLITVLFSLSGCNKTSDETKNNKEETNLEKVTIQGEEFSLRSNQTLEKLHYKENYVDFYSDAIGNMRMMTYKKEDNLIFEVRLMYDESRSISELKAILEAKNQAKEQSKEINGIKYIYYDYEEDNTKVHIYMYAFDGKSYSIGFFLGENPGNIEEVFMNNVTFS